MKVGEAANVKSAGVVKIGKRQLSLEDFHAILFRGALVELDAEALAHVEKGFSFLKDFSRDKVIYGINTGFGPMAQHKIIDHEQEELQYNLIRSHASGMGQRIPDVYVKALMIARLNTLMQGFSGIHTEAIYLLRDLINKEIYPCIFEHGGVGASGDLVQLSHLALTLIGEGEVHYQGHLRPTEEVFAELGIQPLSMHLREGLAIMNGTSVMSGIGIINTLYGLNLVNWMVAASSMINEIVESFDDHFSEELNAVKHHEGQQHIAAGMRKALKESGLIRRRKEVLYDRKVEENVLKVKVQEYYSVRCVPQILGPVYDTLKYTEKILLDEISSANDNPIIDPDRQDVFHGGNFHGDYVSLEMDKIKLAITKLSMLSERQLNYLLNHKLNEKLPPFANLGKLGFNFGMQGVQFTATSTVAENQTLSGSAYIHSIPNNNDNQDIVSMGANAALITRKVIENTYEVLAIEMMTILQAVDYLEFESKMAPATRKVYQELRALVPRFEGDTPKYLEIRKLKSYLLENRLDLV